MPIQTATTGNLEDAQNIVIGAIRYTAEHNAPCKNLVERFTLGQGEKSMVIPKVGQATAQNLTDGGDLVDSQDIGLSTKELTTAEVGLKFILTDKLVRQFNENAFKVIGRQMGDAMARKADTDLIALFSSLNGGTVLGADGAKLNTSNCYGLAAWATANKLPDPVFCVHHPYALGQFAKSAAGIGYTYYAGIMQGFPEEMLRNFWAFKVDRVNFFHDGNIAKEAGVDSGIGVLASKGALCYIESKSMNTERERDASLRAWEVVVVADYGVFELDDTLGAGAQYEIGALATNSTAP